MHLRRFGLPSLPDGSHARGMQTESVLSSSVHPAARGSAGTPVWTEHSYGVVISCHGDASDGAVGVLPGRSPWVHHFAW